MTNIALGTIQPDGTCDLAWSGTGSEGTLGDYKSFSSVKQMQAYIRREGVTDYTIKRYEPNADGEIDFVVVSRLTEAEDALDAAGLAWEDASEAERAAAAAAYEAIRNYIAAGGTEVAAAKIARVNRGTVRQALGKPRA